MKGPNFGTNLYSELGVSSCVVLHSYHRVQCMLTLHAYVQITCRFSTTSPRSHCTLQLRLSSPSLILPLRIQLCRQSNRYVTRVMHESDVVGTRNIPVGGWRIVGGQIYLFESEFPTRSHGLIQSATDVSVFIQYLTTTLPFFESHEISPLCFGSPRAVRLEFVERRIYVLYESHKYRISGMQS